ncbi:MAG TPA: hypothetical protein PKD27_10630, partial [Tepidiformaceae bacterium]|nr:hypothetical protein [Tepidiformaceae bacterium]
PTRCRSCPVADALHHAGPEDRFFDYCLEPYRPRRPWQGKLRSENLLWQALGLAGIEDAARPVIEALRAVLGRDMVVFGVKHDGARLFFELYVYDARKEEPAASVAGLSAALAATLPIEVPVRESIPYMMVSFDLDAAAGEVQVAFNGTGVFDCAGAGTSVTCDLAGEGVMALDVTSLRVIAVQ